MGLDLKMPILVVDDYQTMVRIIRNLLKQLGFEDVDDANDGHRGAPRQAQGEEVRARHLGLEHGADDGLELLRHVRSDENLRVHALHHW